MRKVRTLIVLVLVAGTLAMPRAAGAHCDTLDGPVVKAARLALERGDVAPVLKWVQQADEAAIRDAFAKTLAVRKAGPPARDLADQWFFETLVRLHRQGEGAPYTGLKPAGSDLNPAVAASDKALEAGNADGLVKLVTEAAEKGLRARFAHAAEAAGHADHNVDAGRAYVAAYVEFTHYAERLYLNATTAAGHAAGAAAAHEHR